MYLLNTNIELFRQVNIRYETKNTRAVAEMNMEGKRPRGRPTLRWEETVRRDMKALAIQEENETARINGRYLQDPLPHTGRRRWPVRKLRKHVKIWHWIYLHPQSCSKVLVEGKYEMQDSVGLDTYGGKMMGILEK